MKFRITFSKIDSQETISKIKFTTTKVIEKELVDVLKEIQK